MQHTGHDSQSTKAAPTLDDSSDEDGAHMPSPPVDMGKANVAEAVSTGHTSCPRCCWCLRRVEHVGVCPNRILPKMSDFPGQTGPTRHSNLRNRRPTKPGGHRQTARSASEQQLHARNFTRWYNARCRELEREAEQRKLEREQVLLTALARQRRQHPIA